MNKLVFVGTVIGIWGMALFWIAMEPPKTNAIMKEQIDSRDAEFSCDLVSKIHLEVSDLSEDWGLVHLVPELNSMKAEACSNGQDEDDPRANQIRGGFQRRKIIVSTLDAFIPV